MKLREAISKKIIQPKSLLLIFISTAVIVITSAVIELTQSRQELVSLMEKQTHSLLEAMIISSRNAIDAYEQIELEAEERLLDNASYIKLLYDDGKINNKALRNFANKHNIYRINIFDSKGNKIHSSSEEIHAGAKEKNNPRITLAPLFSGIQDTMIIGVKNARFVEGKRYAVALRAKNNNAIVLNIDAEELLSFRKGFGFGSLLQKITSNPGIVYAALQDEEGIIAASGNVDYLESINETPKLMKSFKDSIFVSHVREFQNKDVFEAAHPFSYKGEIIGIFRLGLTLDELNAINDRIIRRLIVIGILLLVFGSILFISIFIKQNFNVLQKRFTAFEEYSKKVIENVSDSIIVINETHNLITANNSAKKLFGFIENDEFAKNFPKQIINDILETSQRVLTKELEIEGSIKTFLISQNSFTDEGNNKNYIILIKDITEGKLLEEQIQRKERLSAMGELASGVAHEIRNPLNSIGTIIQQLSKDFKPKENAEEYDSFTKLIYNEVKRINSTVEGFLRFTKPDKLNKSVFKIDSFFSDLIKQYDAISKEKEIKLIYNSSENFDVNWDYNKIKQVFINLLENSIYAINNNGTIKINVNEIENSNLEILLSDNGSGIAKETINKIFNLYYTTKPEGNGIGLSLVQKIIFEHDGIISVNSEVENGTTFKIQIPK